MYVCIYIYIYICVCVCVCVCVVFVWVSVWFCVVWFFFINTKHAPLHCAILHAMLSLISLLFVLY